MQTILTGIWISFKAIQHQLVSLRLFDIYTTQWRGWKRTETSKMLANVIWFGRGTLQKSTLTRTLFPGKIHLVFSF